MVCDNSGIMEYHGVLKGGFIYGYRHIYIYYIKYIYIMLLLMGFLCGFPWFSLFRMGYLLIVNGSSWDLQVTDTSWDALSPNDAHGSVTKRSRRHALRCHRPSCQESRAAGEKGRLFHRKYESWLIIPLITNIH